MTTERSTYTYEDGAQETVTLRRGPATPHGHALLKIKDSSGRIVDGYVNTAWLHDRANDLDPRPLTPDAITDEMVERGQDAYWGNERTVEGRVRAILTAALSEPPARPEGAEKVEAVLHQYWSGDIDGDDLADRIAEEMNR